MNNITIDFKCGPLFFSTQEAYKNSECRIICHQGSARSGKTWSILQWLIINSLQQKIDTTIVSINSPHIRRGALKDWKIIMNEAGLFHDSKWSETNKIYKFDNGSNISFVSCDEPEKYLGISTDDLFINEAILLDYEIFNNLNLRTRNKIIMDYNPITDESWIYSKIIPRKDCIFIKSNYTQNIFLPKVQADEIENLKNIDPYLYSVYALGEIGKRENQIFNNLEIVESFENMPLPEYTIYGLDFGIRDPTVLLSIGIFEKSLYVTELIYESELINSELIEKMKGLNIPDCAEIYADSAEPGRIQEIYNSGFNCFSALKGPGSVNFGINKIKEFTVYSLRSNINFNREFKNYSWKMDKNGRVLSEPVHLYSHCPDGLKYALATHLQKYMNSYFNFRIF